MASQSVLFHPNFTLYSSASNHYLPTNIGDDSIMAMWASYNTSGANSIAGEFTVNGNEVLRFNQVEASGDPSLSFLPDRPIAAFTPNHNGLMLPWRANISSVTGGQVIVLHGHPRGVSRDSHTDQDYVQWTSAGNRNLHANVEEGSRIVSIHVVGTLSAELLLGGTCIDRWDAAGEAVVQRYPIPLPTRWFNSGSGTDLRIDITSYTSGNVTVVTTKGRP